MILEPACVYRACKTCKCDREFNYVCGRENEATAHRSVAERSK